jgi:hypothetical protein
LYAKNEKTASTEIDFIQKQRKILLNHDRRFKDEQKYYPKCFESFEIFFFKNRQNLDFLAIHRQFFSN